VGLTGPDGRTAGDVAGDNPAPDARIADAPFDSRALELDALMRAVAKDDPFSPGAGFPSVAFQSRRFEFLHRLGSGGFGVVYLARDLATGESLAVKTIPAPSAELVYRLKREFRALADLRHENLVSFYELFVEEDRVFLTMEYVPGTNFLSFVRGTGLDERRLRGALAQLVAGLSALHAAGKMHRDVKPSNVLVTPEERVVLLDFGLATEITENELGASIVLAGTPEYMSPEHARNASLSPASDWYSVGVLLHQALTGKVPFRGTRTELILQHEAARATVLGPMPGVPDDLADLCRSLLAYEPGRRPGPEEIRAVLGRFATQHPPPDARIAEAPFVGRTPELDALRRGLGRVKSGETVAVLIEGASGAGKTSLVRQFLSEIEREVGPIILRGRCYERERVPYAGFDSLTDDLCRFLHSLDPPALGTLLPRNMGALVQLFSTFERVPTIAHQPDSFPLVSPDRQEVRRKAFDAFRELLARIADRRVLILHIDDLQWGDLDTAALIRVLLRAPDSPRMLLILAFRSEERERSACLQALNGDAFQEPIRLHLGPLPGHEAELLLQHLLAGRSRRIDTAALARDAEGNPFLIQELAWFVAGRGEEWEAGAPLDVYRALRARVDRLPVAARKLLETLAVAGHPVPELVAWRAAGQSGAPSEGSGLLSSHHLVRASMAEGERQLEPFHDRIREAVVARLSLARTRECHQRLAEALEASRVADPEVLASHHEAAGNPARALKFFVPAAARAQQVLAFDRAARLLQRAVDLVPQGDPRRYHLLASLGEALANAGKAVEAGRTYLAAAAGEAAEVQTGLRRRAAEQLLFAGQIEEAKRLIGPELRANGFGIPGGPRRALLSVLWNQLHVRTRGLEPGKRGEATPERLALLEHVHRLSMGLTLVEAATGASLGTHFALEALHSGDPRIVALGTLQLAGHSMPWPFSSRTNHLFTLARKRVEAVGDRGLLAFMLTVEGFRQWASSNWREVVRILDAADPVLREDAPDRVWELWTSRSMANRSLFFVGRWTELRRRVFAGLSLARECGHIYGMATMCANFGIGAWLSHGDPAGARRSLREVAAIWTVPGLQQFWFLAAHILIDLYLGDGEAAWARLRAGSPDIRRSLQAAYPVNRLIVYHLCGCAALAAAAQRGLSAGGRRELLKTTEILARKLDKVEGPSARPLAELLHGGIAAQRGEMTEAARHLGAGVLALDSAGMRAHADAARRHLARIRGEPLPPFLAGEEVAAPDAAVRMLAPGFPAA
jgi:ABC-type iron transport system FetAB ATPase subunit